MKRWLRRLKEADADGRTGWTLACIGCGAPFPDIDGPTHRYMESSPGCWACFGEVLAREYSDYRYARAHRLTVDAYAVQHPGRPSPQSVQSVALHLMSLCAIIEKDGDHRTATKMLKRASKQKGLFQWIEPPSSMGRLTVLDVQRASDADEHVSAVREWAASAWSAWSEHHASVRNWLSRLEL